MDRNWKPSLEFVWGFDGLRNDAAPGEKFTTSYGVTQMTWERALRLGVNIPQDITLANKTDCAQVLYQLFWRVIHADKMEDGVDLVMFNHAMLAGPDTAVRLAQRVVGEDEDGFSSAETLLAMKGVPQVELIEMLTKADEFFFQTLRNAPLFLKGWDRRAEAAQKAALELIIKDGG